MGLAFCSSQLYPSGARTKTATVVASVKKCKTVTITSTQCVASAFIEALLECEILSKVNSTGDGSGSATCLLGVEDFPFGTQSTDGNIHPGLCGY
jgi:hypothetical protein